MTDLSDETLLAYADGMLEPEEVAAVEQQLAEDRAAQERLEALREGGRLAQLAFPEPNDDGKDDPFAKLLMAEEETAEPVPKVVAFPKRREKPRGLAAWTLPLAASLALAVGLAAGLSWERVAGTGGTSGDLLAAGPVASDSLLHRALEGSASYESLEEAEGSVTPLLSFRDSRGHYCREYQTVEAGKAAAGLACKTDGSWLATAVVAFPDASGSDYTTASGPAAELLSSLLQQEMQGEPLTSEEERQAIKGAWQQ